MIRFSIFLIALLISLSGGLSFPEAQEISTPVLQPQTSSSDSESVLLHTPGAGGFFLPSTVKEMREIAVTAVLPDPPHKPVADFRGFSSELCVTCHEGIEEIDQTHPRSFGCTVCHGGNGNSVNAETAHEGLIYSESAGTGKRNPSSLDVVEKSCGLAGCHSGHAQADRNIVSRVRSSMMGTLAGMISGLRYRWGAQADRKAHYGVYGIEKADKPEEAGDEEAFAETINKLSPLPYAFEGEAFAHRKRLISDPKISNHPADSLLRGSCFQCHIDSPPAQGTWRSQGCAACHFEYSKEGKYEGADATISKSETGHPRYHKMTALPKAQVCTTCHQGFRDQPRALPGMGQPKLDIHVSAGLDCIDCHTQFDIMGDGVIYSKQHQAVEIRCETCHGDGLTLPESQKITDNQDPAIRSSKLYPGMQNAIGDTLAVSARGRKISNVKRVGKDWVLFEKRTGTPHKIPMSRNIGHSIKQHMQKMECSACHSQSTPRCNGCHLTMDQSTKAAGKNFNAWQTSRFTVKAVEPALMVGPRGKVAPMLSRGPHFLNLLDEGGHPIPARDEMGRTLGFYKNWQFSNPDRQPGGHNAYAFSPHSVGTKVRSCASCHANPRALGLGEGNVIVGNSKTGKNDRMDSVRKVSENLAGNEASVNLQGQALAGTSQAGARLLNQEEITRILRVGNCIPCHDRYNDPIYQNLRSSYKFQKSAAHTKYRNKLLLK